VGKFNMATSISLIKLSDPTIAVLAQYTGEILRERLLLMKLQPKMIFDLGCQSEEMTPALKKRFPFSDVATINFPENKLAELMVANLTLIWQADLLYALKQIRQQLSVGGLLMLTALGPDTLNELPDRSLVLPQLIDMHHLGDALVQAGFSDPVLDVEYVTITYRDSEKLFYEMCATKMIHENAKKLSLIPNEEHIFSLTFEVIHAHAFAAAPKFLADESGVTRFPAGNILRRYK